MLNCFPIEFVRQILDQKLEMEHKINANFYGGKEQVAIASFYEQLQSQEDVDRFMANYRDLANQQNRAKLLLNGVILSPENPSITNLYNSLIVPMEWTCSMRCTLGDRDGAIHTINNLIEKLKGRKVDVAQLNGVDFNGKPCSVPFMVGTIGQNDGNPALKNGDYIGDLNSIDNLSTILYDLSELGITLDTTKTYYVYCTNASKLKVAKLEYVTDEQTLTSSWTYTIVVDDGTNDIIIFPPSHTSFEKFKVSLSFDAIRCDEPRNLNEKEYCHISFGGSATLVNNNIVLGNDLLKVYVSKYQIPSSTIFSYSSNGEFLEPLEMPSSNNINSEVNQLVSNNFKSNSHADAIAISLQYTFMIDLSSSIIAQWFGYARYGVHSPEQNSVSPNTIYFNYEIWSGWGDYRVIPYKAKIVENIDVENTESDVLTLTVSFQIQGDNN